MKGKICPICIVLVLAVVLLSGCSSVRAVLKSNVSGLPYWYYEPQMNVDKNKVGMTAEGSATTQRQAELVAYNDVIMKLSERIGSELGSDAYRELSVLGTITEFGLEINDTFISSQEGRYTVYIHVSMDRTLLEQATTDETKRREGLSGRVSDLVLKGDEYVKSGSELKAVSNYIMAMALSHGQDYISSEYKFDELYPVVVELLQNMYLTVLAPRPENASCVVSITRRGAFVSSVVSSAKVTATFKAEDSRGEQYEDYFVFVTDGNGQFVFNPLNATMVRDGSVRFGLDLSQELKMLEDAVGTGKVAELRKLVESKAVVFEYSKLYSMESLAVAVIEHDELGDVTGVKDITDYMTSKFTDEYAEAKGFYAELDEEEDVFYEFTHSGRPERYLLVLRIGRTEHFSSRTGVDVAGAEGMVTLFDTESENPIYQSELILSNAFGETYEEAEQGAFRILADIAYSLVKAVYV